MLATGRGQEPLSDYSVPITVLGDGDILGGKEEPLFPFPSFVPLAVLGLELSHHTCCKSLGSRSQVGQSLLHRLS